MVEALCRSDADLSTMRVVCDWIQYKANFRDTVMVRPVIAADGPTVTSVAGYELAVDLRRCASPETDVAGEVTAALSEAVHVTRGTAAGACGLGGGAGDPGRGGPRGAGGGRR